jgi:hypothetical protein
VTVRLDSTRRAVRKVLRDARDKNKWRKIVRIRLWMPVALQLLLIGAVAFYTSSRFPGFLSASNLRSILILAIPLALVAIAQTHALLVGYLDLSVGAMISLSVVIASFLIFSGATTTQILIGIGAIVLCGLAVGLVNAGLVRGVKIPSIIATLATLSILDGISLTLRGTPGGTIDRGFTELLRTSVGPIPVALILVVVGAGLPHLPAVLSASKSYSERLFRYIRIDRLDREAADQALVAPAADEGVCYAPEALDALYTVTDGYPYFVQAYGKVTWDHAPTIPITENDVRQARLKGRRITVMPGQKITPAALSMGRELGITVVVITHEMDVVRSICDRVAVMEHGRVVELGDAYQVFSAPREPVTRRFVATALKDRPSPAVLARLRARHTGRIVTVAVDDVTGSSAHVTHVLREHGVDGTIVYGGITEVAERPYGSLTLELVGDEGDDARVRAAVAGLRAVTDVDDHGTAADPVDAPEEAPAAPAEPAQADDVAGPPPRTRRPGGGLFGGPTGFVEGNDL